MQRALSVAERVFVSCADARDDVVYDIHNACTVLGSLCRANRNFAFRLIWLLL